MAEILTTNRIIPTSKREWLELRRSLGIGASEASAVLGENPYASPFTVYCEKRGLVPLEKDEQNEPAEWGLRLEGVIAAKYAEETGREIVAPPQFEIRMDPEFPHTFATLDREVLFVASLPDFAGVETGPLELKSTGAHNEHLWEDGIPRWVWIQVQHQMAIARAGRGSVAVLIGGQAFRWTDVTRDQDFIAQMMPELARFWTEHVLAGVSPEADGSWRAKELLSQLYPEHDTRTIALDGEFIELDERLERVKGDIKALYSERDELENKLRESIADAEAAMLPNGVVYSWKKQSRAECVMPATSFRVLRRHAPKRIGGRR